MKIKIILAKGYKTKKYNYSVDTRIFIEKKASFPKTVPELKYQNFIGISSKKTALNFIPFILFNEKKLL